MHTTLPSRGSRTEAASRRASLDHWMGEALTRTSSTLAAYVRAEVLARAALAAKAGDMPAEALVYADLSERMARSAGEDLPPDIDARIREAARAFVTSALSALHPPPRCIRGPVVRPVLEAE